MVNEEREKSYSSNDFFNEPFSYKYEENFFVFKNSVEEYVIECDMLKLRGARMGVNVKPTKEMHKPYKAIVSFSLIQLVQSLFISALANANLTKNFIRIRILLFLFYFLHLDYLISLTD